MAYSSQKALVLGYTCHPATSEMRLVYTIVDLGPNVVPEICLKTKASGASYITCIVMPGDSSPGCEAEEGSICHCIGPQTRIHNEVS